MSEILTDAAFADVMTHFEKIASIPRMSGREDAISDYIRSYAENKGLQVYQDPAMNLVIRKPASKGREQDPVVMIQGHLDMVCDKLDTSSHDFRKDPLKLVREGDWIHADGTSLGADDGVALAYALALMDDEVHSLPALEIVLTASEETGCSGAYQLNMDVVTASLMVNINSEVENKVFTSCAGGVGMLFSMDLNRVEHLDNFIPVEIRIFGLQGGHSGEDIHLRRGNPIKILSDFLFKWYNLCVETRLSSINGGILFNTIPHSCAARIWIPASRKSDLEKECWYCGEELVRTYQMSEPGAKITASFPGPESCMGPDWSLTSAEDTGRILSFLNLCPNGVVNMSQTQEGLVETSCNFGRILTEEHRFSMKISVRSIMNSKMDMLCDRLKLMADLNNIHLDIEEDFPAWIQHEDTYLTRAYMEAYREAVGAQITESSVHAGIECGVFCSHDPWRRAISIGPNIENIHSYNEKLSVSSFERVYRTLLTLLNNIHGY